LKRILVVDDERQITRMLRASLQSSGYDVLVADNGVDAYKRFETDKPDLIITDLAMPEMNGLELTQAIRRVSQTPIIVLSVRNTDQMKINALDEGADDYLTKPFSMPELLARVRAQLRRTPDREESELRVEAGDFVIDADAHMALVRGQAIHLTPKEFDLLLLFAQNPNRVMTHKTLRAMRATSKANRGWVIAFALNHLPRRTRNLLLFNDLSMSPLWASPFYSVSRKVVYAPFPYLCSSRARSARHTGSIQQPHGRAPTCSLLGPCIQRHCL